MRIGTGWKKEDLGKVQIMVERNVIQGILIFLRKGIDTGKIFLYRYLRRRKSGDGYSLAREMIAECAFDAGVYLARCDKEVPGNLMGLARVNIPSVMEAN